MIHVIMLKVDWRIENYSPYSIDLMTRSFYRGQLRVVVNDYSFDDCSRQYL
jgi:hypothetical protein